MLGSMVSNPRELANGYQKWWALEKCIETASNMTSFWVFVKFLGGVITGYTI